ncbi:MAG: universal stress protein, partial [Myxococcales bacterium]|nr:universal stress protein [Myxococcales bacterium]
MSFISAIVVAVDFSEHSDAALSRALSLAAALGVSLHIVHVHQKPASWDEMESDVVEAMERYAKRAAERGVYSTTDILEGDVVTTLREALRDYAADLLVIGTRGVGRVRRAVFGSVAERAMREVAAPVLVVGETGDRAAEPIGKILFASDFSEPASEAFEQSLELAKRLSASIEVVHVVNPAGEVSGPYGVPASAKTIAERDERIRAQLDRTRRALVESGVEGATVPLRGTEEAALAERIRSSGSDLVVVGASS